MLKARKRHSEDGVKKRKAKDPRANEYDSYARCRCPYHVVGRFFETNPYATGSVRDGAEYDFTYTRGRTIMYRVDGVPAGEYAEISDHGWPNGWRIFHRRDGVVVDWPNQFETAQDALQAMEAR